MRVGIIGAAASGLPAIRICLEYGFEPVCLEKQHEIGGLWNYKPHECEGESSVMKSTVINTSKEMTAYSDFPPPKDFANFMHNRRMYEYLKLYADRFQLLKYVRFGITVLEVRRAQDYASTGKYDIQYKDNKSGEENVETYDAVLLCSGHHVDPYVATFPNQEKFKGTILHSHSYKSHVGYEDKRVVVVGVGNSGGDVAVELSKISEQVYLVTRRGTWVVNRIADYGIPVDIARNTRFFSQIKASLPSITSWYMEHYLQSRFDHETYGLKPNHGPFQAHFTVNDELPNRIACGTVIIKTQIKEFTENGVKFTDGTSVDNIDTVVLSTGYSFRFPYLEGGKLIPVEENQVSLYQYMYPPELQHPSMAVVGLVQPSGSVMPISELQCRVFCDMLSGRSKFPTKAEMEANIAKKKKDMAELFVPSRRHTIQVAYDVYMDELAELIGAKPNVVQTLVRDPTLGLALLFGPMVAYQYRLKGPHPWEGARDAIMGVKERVEYATKTRKDVMIKNKSQFKWILLGFLIALYFLLF